MMNKKLKFNKLEKYENNNMWLTRLINQNSKKLKLSINGSKIKLPNLKHENNNMWLNKLIN